MLSTRFVAARFLAALAPAGRLATPRSAVLPRVAALHSTRMQLSDNFGMDDSGARPPSEKQVHAHSLRLSYLLLGDARAKISPKFRHHRSFPTLICSPLPSLPAQVQFAQRLSQQLGIDLPAESLTDQTRCSSFIDEALDKVPPSNRQLEFARSISQNANIELPEHATRSSRTISAYIEANQHLAPAPAGGGMGGGMGDKREPTSKQIVYAASLARQLSIGLEAEVLADRFAISQFIDEAQARVRQGGGGFSGGGFSGIPGAGGVVPAAGAAGAAAAGGADASAAGSSALDPELDSMFADAPGGAEDETPYFKEGAIPF